MSETKSETVKITLEISQRDYDIISKVLAARGETIQDIIVDDLRSTIDMDLQESLGIAMGYGDHPCYDHVFEEEGVQV
ncbi:MAG: hypothetical protein FVQ80_13815 [Planctomycetes bacterium]|nr:hypothetical protein [Planctomycetota bacterium]